MEEHGTASHRLNKQIPLVNVLDRLGSIGDMSVNTGFSPVFKGSDLAHSWRRDGIAQGMQASQAAELCMFTKIHDGLT